MTELEQTAQEGHQAQRSTQELRGKVVNTNFYLKPFFLNILPPIEKYDLTIEFQDGSRRLCRYSGVEAERMHEKKFIVGDEVISDGSDNFRQIESH